MPALVQNINPSPIPQDAIMESSAADKKRNKLGYHRTSVACGKLSSPPPSVCPSKPSNSSPSKCTVDDGKSDAFSPRMMLRDDARTASDCEKSANSFPLTSSLPSRRNHARVPDWKRHRQIPRQPRHRLPLSLATKQKRTSLTNQWHWVRTQT